MKKNNLAVVGLSVVLSGILAISSFSPYAYASGVAIQSLSPGSTISVGTSIQFDISTSGFTSPSFTVSDSFGGTTVSSGNIDSNGHFSWTPSSGDAGTHNLTVSISDSNGNSATVSEQLIVTSVNSSGVGIQAIYPGSTVYPGQNLTLIVSAAGYNSPTYSLSDSFSGTLSGSNINSSGYLTWTPTQSDIGTHNLNITVTDGSGRQGSASQSIIVQAPNVVVSGLTPSLINPGTQVSFMALAGGFTNPFFSVSDSFGGTSMSSGDINNSGIFNWTPMSYDVGTHDVTVYVSDAMGHRSNEQFQINVLSPGQTAVVTSVVTTASDGYKFKMPLHIKSKGKDVTELQKRLKAEGVYSGDITGYYGLQTETAVKLYQSKHGLDRLGNVGPGTRAVLNK